MSELVELWPKRKRGWPWPDDSWGLSPVYGEDGWCRSCGVPKGPQAGPLVLRGKGFTASEGAWMPYWREDAVCLGSTLSEEVGERFPAVSLMPVEWRSGKLGPASQIIPVVSSEPWFDPEELRERVLAQHTSPGDECGTCGVWRWNPVLWARLPQLRTQIPDDVEVAASPEWFGSGLESFRQLVFRRPLAEMIARGSPRDFKVDSLP